MKIVASASIGGVKTNRVKVKRIAQTNTGRALSRYRQDPTVRGMDTVITCISLPVQELAELDEVCERVQMARSHFIRQAVKLLRQQLLNQGGQERRWKEALR